MAVNSFTIMLASKLRNTKFRVNSVTQGYAATDLNDFKGTKSVQEGVKPIIRLVTSNSEYVTGEFLKVIQCPGKAMYLSSNTLT
jgi:NAD(P)-dependent dehydrogenase (short-subunit alcohol dehydrogenase family)